MKPGDKLNLKLATGREFEATVTNIDELTGTITAAEYPDAPSWFTECVPDGCQCDCHKPGMHISHVVACCDGSRTGARM